MIDAILCAALGREIKGASILDIGCGNGDISQHFAGFNVAYGVDISDRRRPEHRAFSFQQVSSELLPFGDGFFDLVLSHHVVEHVANQKLHLSEIHRVLKPDGMAYLATPNRSSPIMQGHVGNNSVLHYRQMRPLFESMGFLVEEMSISLLKQPRRFHAEVRMFAFLPVALLSLLRPFFPSHVFILKPVRASAC